MRRLILVATFAVISLPASAGEAVTVALLRQRVISLQTAGASDADIAKQIGSLELNEQLTASTFDRMVAELKLGPNAAIALDLLADSSVSLDPPASEIPTKAQPTIQEQQAIVEDALKFAAVTMHQLPNLLATRGTRTFDNFPPLITNNGWAPPNSQLHLVGTFAQEITYRNGREAVTHLSSSGASPKSPESPPGLTTRGEFGPLLSVILIDSSRGKVRWSHWEQTNAGLEAVIHFEVPKIVSHYLVDYCCVRDSAIPMAGVNDGADPSNAYHGTPGYHGSLYLDPGSGEILRVTLSAELEPTDPISQLVISVQYGAVEIGGKGYVCPVRGIATSFTRRRFHGELVDRKIKRINEVSFTNYRRFGSTSRILSAEPIH